MANANKVLASSLLEGTSEPFETQGLLDSIDSASEADATSSDEDDTSSGSELSSRQDDRFRSNLAHIRETVANLDPISMHSVISPSVGTENPKPSGKPIAEVPQLLETIRFTITCLYRIPIRRPATVDRSKKLSSIDLSYFEPFDKAYIEEKCPAASDWLKQRFQQMIYNRRRLLHYRARHYKNIKPNLSEVAFERPHHTMEPTHGNTASEPMEIENLTPSEHQSSRPSQISKATTFDPSRFPTLPQDLLNADNVSIPESMPSTNPSLWTGKQKLYVPPRPKPSEGTKEFLCPYCFVVCQVKSDESWKYVNH